MRGSTGIRWATLVVWLAVGAVTMPVNGAESVSSQCEPQTMVGKTVAGDLTGAIQEAKRCVSWSKAYETKTSPDVGLNQDNIIPVTALGYYQCAQAQLEAATGDLKSARVHLADAEATDQKWAAFLHSPLIIWYPVLDVTRGFLLEKSGDLTGAKKWYADHPGGYTEIRLAALALIESRDDDAAAIARQLLSSDPEDPNGWFVTGALAEKRHDNSAAISDYERALRRTEKVGNQFLPIYYLNSARAREGIARLKDK
jgi:hypothetical protein